MSQRPSAGRRDFSVDPGLIRIILLAVVIGALGAVLALGLLSLIFFFTNLFFLQRFSFAPVSPAANTLGAWVIVLPVIGGLIVGLMARYGSERIRGHGIPEVIEIILYGKSRISAGVAFLKPLSSSIAIGSGGPFGAEGPIIMTGGAAGSLIAQFFRLTAVERKTLLVAGATAGMTGIFGTPVAAVLLAVELLLFEWRPRSLLPVIVACTIAGFTRPLLLGAGPMFALQVAPPVWESVPSCVVLGVLAGLLAVGLSAALYKVEDGFHKLPLHWMWWPAIAGVGVGIGGYFEPRALGVGYDVIGDLLNNRLALGVVLALILVKITIWILALGSGTSGGVLAPALLIGAGLGAAFVPLLGGDAHLWPLIGMAALFSGVFGAPLTATVFAIEITHGINAALPVLLACGSSYAVTVSLASRSLLTEKIARRGLRTYREYGVDPLERQSVEEIMTRDVQTIPAETTVAEALLQYFSPQQEHRAFPAVDASGKVIGIVERPVLLMQNDKTVFVGDLFGVNPPLLALPEETCRIAAARMARYGVERLPVVENLDSRRLIGILSRSDLVKPLQNFFEEEQKREQFFGRQR